MTQISSSSLIAIDSIFSHCLWYSQPIVNHVRRASCDLRKNCIMDGHQSFRIKDSDGVSSTVRVIDEGHKCVEKSDSCPIDEVEMRRVFERFDEDGNGLISADELKRYMKRLGHNQTDSEAISMIQSVDLNNDGCVDFDEFLSLYKTYSCPGTSEVILDREEDDLLEAFRIFDKDKDGYISAQELQAVLLDLGLLEGKSLQNCQKMIQKVDEDGNGQCDIEEFKKMMAS